MNNNTIKSSSLLPIQQIVFPHSNIPSLFNSYAIEVSGNAKTNKKGNFVVDTNSKVSFNSYFNSFYEIYWKTYCELDKIYFRFELEGSCKISIYRDSSTNGCYLLLSEKINHKTMELTEFEILLNDSNCIIPNMQDSGRIFIDIETSEEEHVELKNIEILTDKINNNSLSIGICTFNREDFLFKNLANLVKLSKTFSHLTRILVINQGQEFSNSELLNLLEQNKNLIEVHKQANLGGTGGFTRTLYEVSRNKLSDYHLLMDDDIILDCNIIRTAFNFISLAKKEIAVGGQMLDLFRPNFMHEYGGKIGDNGNIKGLFRDTNLSDVRNLLVWNKIVPIDYNAWWFCIIPTKEIEQINLPAPIFIRGDDWEYGLRLKERGVETVGLPGIGLWHEPFYAKVGGWQTYYDFRNRMISAAVHKQLKPETPNRLFLRIYNLLLCHDYQSVSLILEAIRDFARGADLFKIPAQTIHEKVSALAKEYTPTNIPNLNFVPVSENKIRAKFFSIKRKLLFLKQTLGLYFCDYSTKEPLHLYDRHVAPQNVNCMPYIKTNGTFTYFYLYKHDKKIFRQLLWELLKVKKLYRESIKIDKYQNIEEYREFNFWKNIFENKE